MICAISGEAPQAPVVSRKSGNVYERRLIEQYIRENGTDPVNGEELATDDLLDLKQPRAVKPRAPTQTSIPALLSTFQNEWDALILETFQLKQALATTRQELSTALYYNESAEKVIARLTKERDEAREALSNVTVSASRNGANGFSDAMQIDGQSLPEDVIARFDHVREELSKTRRKRAIPETWATADLISTFDQGNEYGSVVGQSRFLAADQTKDLVLVGGADGAAVVFSQSKRQVIHSLDCGSASVVAGVWAGQRCVVGLSNGAVSVFEGATEVATFTSHAGSVTAVCLHPCGDVLVSAGVDKNCVMYDLQSMKQIRQHHIESDITCADIHPDGHLLCLGTSAGSLEMFDTKTMEKLAEYSASSGDALQAMCFSENGTWLAANTRKQTGVSIWDLRKGAILHNIELDVTVSNLAWDYTGQYLAIAGQGCIAVSQYSKATKSWSQPWLKAWHGVVDLTWGPDARSLVTVDAEGGLRAIMPA